MLLLLFSSLLMNAITNFLSPICGLSHRFKETIGQHSEYFYVSNKDIMSQFMQRKKTEIYQLNTFQLNYRQA